MPGRRIRACRGGPRRWPGRRSRPRRSRGAEAPPLHGIRHWSRPRIVAPSRGRQPAREPPPHSPPRDMATACGLLAGLRSTLRNVRCRHRCVRQAAGRHGRLGRGTPPPGRVHLAGHPQDQAFRSHGCRAALRCRRWRPRRHHRLPGQRHVDRMMSAPKSTVDGVQPGQQPAAIAGTAQQSSTSRCARVDPRPEGQVVAFRPRDRCGAVARRTCRAPAPAAWSASGPR